MGSAAIAVGLIMGEGSVAMKLCITSDTVVDSAAGAIRPSVVELERVFDTL